MSLFSKRIPSLDGLRAISVVFVFGGHFLYTLGFSDFLNLGILGVRFFFVISGFLITGLLLRELDTTSSVNLPKFYFRRTLRIFPPYYFFLFVLLTLAFFAYLPIPLSAFAAPFTYTSNYINVPDWNLLHTWSLSVEEQFYLIFPFFLLFLGRKKMIPLLIALVLACPALRLIDLHLFADSGKMWIYYGFHANADGLAVGCLMAIFYEKLHSSPAYRALLDSRWMVMAPLCLLLINAQIDPRPFYLGAVFTISNFFIALCIDWAVTKYDENAIGRFLNSAPMTKVGMMSYSIYLWQQPFLNHDKPAWFTSFPINIIGIIVMSMVSYYAVEKGSLHLRQKLEKRLFPAKR